MRSAMWAAALAGAALVTCISAKARADEAMGRRACEARGLRPTLSGCAELAQHAKVGHARSGKSKASQLRKPSITGDVLRRPEKAPLERQSRKLLLGEIQRLEALLRVTHPKSPDRPQLVRRIAEDYAELAALAERDRIVAELRAEALKPDSAPSPTPSRSSKDARRAEPPERATAAPGRL